MKMVEGRTPGRQRTGGRRKEGKAESAANLWEKNLQEKILTGIEDGIWVEDERGFCVWANQRAAQTLGYDTAETLKGKHWSEFVVPDEHSHVQQEWEQRKGGAHSTYHTVFRRTDGRMVPILVSASSIRDGGEYRGTIALLIDYAGQEPFKGQIIQAERLRALGEMAMGVAHDFNNLLSAMLGRAQLLKLHLSKYTGPERRKSTSYLLEGLTLIEQAALDGAEIIRRIQDYTQARGEEDYVRVDLNQVIRDVIELTRPRWKSKAEAEGIRVEIQEDRRHLPPVSGNPSELREVITNLVLNAIDAMPNGGSLIIRTETDRRINKIHIQDTGTGIPPEDLDRIFQPFFTTKGANSSGLGLSVSYGIIRRHGGTLQVKSEPGKGTTFTIQLHVSPEALEESEAERPPRSGRTAKVLVIEDDSRIRANLQETLSMAGHEVTLAENAKQGISLFKEGAYDVVFTDLSMPEISGWELARIIKERDPSVPVALVTGWAVRVDREKLSNSGIDMVISKPFQVNRILNFVMEVLEGKGRRKPKKGRGRE
ncbi:MAG: response regulator [Deltaproteobacteria bacterium]|nr:response regulator [Deltaproteobacteria bacterium]